MGRKSPRRARRSRTISVSTKMLGFTDTFRQVSGIIRTAAFHPFGAVESASRLSRKERISTSGESPIRLSNSPEKTATGETRLKSGILANCTPLPTAFQRSVWKRIVVYRELGIGGNYVRFCKNTLHSDISGAPTTI